MKIKRTVANAKALRPVLASPVMLGRKAWTASDDEIIEYGERLLGGLQKAAPRIAEAGRRMGEAWADVAKSVAKLGDALRAEART